MLTPADELATLTADLLALCDSLGRTGAGAVPVGPVPGLGEPPPASVFTASNERLRPSEPSPPPAASERPPGGAARPVGAHALETPLAPRPAAVADLRTPSRAEPPRASTLPPVVPLRELRRAEAPERPAVTATARPAAPAPEPGAPRPSPLPPESGASRPLHRGDQASSPGGSPSIPAKWAAFLRDPKTAVDEVWEAVGDCRRCGRCSSRKRLVVGVGSARADVLVVTDPPTAEVELLEAALTAAEREMLDNMSQRVLNRQPNALYVVPALFCAGGLEPTPAEVDACRPQLFRLIQTIRPRAVLALGRVAAEVLLGKHAPGVWGHAAETPVMPTFHPRWLLENPGDKRATLDHLQALRRALDRQA